MYKILKFSVIVILIFLALPSQILSCLSSRNMEDFYDRIGSRYSSNYSVNRDQKNGLGPFGFLTKVLISPEQCTGNKDEIGVCVKQSVCDAEKASTIGKCAFGFGTCCLHKTHCDSKVQRVKTNLTHLVQVDRSTPEDFHEVCRYEIPKQKGVVQVRLDFVKFMITEGPNAQDGDCTEDTLMITGARSARGVVGPLCGDLSGQHMFLDFGESNSINLDIYRKEDSNQKWDIVVTFIKWHSEAKAPEGCLQYFSDARGTVKSFNYNLRHQLNNQEYSVCIRTNPGMTKITWKSCGGQPRGYDFIVSTDPPLIPSHPAAPVVGISHSGNSCATDWVMVFGVNKFCGNVFPPSVASTSQPFMLQVRFDSKEFLPQSAICDPSSPPLPPECWSDENNSGFCLEYLQSAA